MAKTTVSQRDFFAEYHGHTVEHLEIITKKLLENRAAVYLVGDSTLDNKYWISNLSERACNGYETVLDNPRCVPDVAFWVNRELLNQGLGDSFCCVNCAVEEATLGLHADGQLLPQDAFVRTHLSGKDVVVVSIGGNDVALRPSLLTIVSMVMLLLSPTWMIERGIAPGSGHFIRLFGDGMRKYVESLCATGREPRLVLCCMLYYLDTKPGGSWADRVLKALGYNSNPHKLQLLLRKVYELATTKITIKNTTVVPVPFFEALDGTNTDDYVQRVEPSSQGGQKLARLIVERMKQGLADAPEKLESGQPLGTGAQPQGARQTNESTVSMPTSKHFNAG